MINKIKKNKLSDLGLKTENSKSSKPAFDNSIAYKISSAFLLPKHPGVYFIHDFRGVLYIGESKNLRNRFLQHFYREENLSLKKMILEFSNQKAIILNTTKTRRKYANSASNKRKNRINRILSMHNVSNGSDIKNTKCN